MEGLEEEQEEKLKKKVEIKTVIRKIGIEEEDEDGGYRESDEEAVSPSVMEPRD